jgi:predicted nucleic-acid-binding Zn-ribbon protein
MKTSHICPKCASRENVYVPTLVDTDQDVLTVKTKLVSAWTGEKVLFGQLEAFICRACGYAEIHAANPTAIPVGEIAGAKILVPDADPLPSR